jgi:hypothetical protein
VLDRYCLHAGSPRNGRYKSSSFEVRNITNGSAAQDPEDRDRRPLRAHREEIAYDDPLEMQAADRGVPRQAEQWIKQGKRAIRWTRLSCRSFAANAVRIQLTLHRGAPNIYRVEYEKHTPFRPKHRLTFIPRS